VSVHIYDYMTLNALPCYFPTHEIHIYMDVIYVNADLLSSDHVLHTSSSTNPITTRENSIEGL